MCQKKVWLLGKVINEALSKKNIEHKSAHNYAAEVSTLLTEPI